MINGNIPFNIYSDLINEYNQKIESFLQWWTATRCPDLSQCEFVIVDGGKGDLPQSRQKDLIKEFRMTIHVDGQEDKVIERKYFCWKKHD